MAQGNMLLGYARGSVGDVTFYRDGGQQRARARNRKPANPRSNRQMNQRAKFAGAVKFYKQSLANFYKMAFENKKPNESDYNAFMRINLAQAPLMSKTAFDKSGYPAIGHWTIAQGSMPTLQFERAYGSQHDALAVILPVKTEERVTINTTIGQLSTILINSGQYMTGDIFTLVRVVVVADSATLATLPTATPEGNWRTYWTVTQIILNTADTRKVGDEFLNLAAGEMIGKDADGYINITNTGDSAFTLVTTRNTANGLKASNSELIVDDDIEAAITTAQGDDYINAVLADWRATGENILQGALASDFEAAIIDRAIIDVVPQSGEDITRPLLVGANNYIVPVDSTIENVIIDFSGQNLPSLDPSEIRCSLPHTSSHDFDTSERQFVQLYFSDDDINAATITFQYAGQQYTLNIFRGAKINGIAYGPNTPLLPPLVETWDNTSQARTYELTPETGEVVYNFNWELPPAISSGVTIASQSGGKYSATIARIANAPSGQYAIKYCGQTLITLTIP